MAEKFEIDQVIEVFDNDTEFTTFIATINVTITDSQKESLAELLIDNRTFIVEYTARELASGASASINSSISSIGLPADFNTLLQIYYTFKYSAVRIFFRTNYKKYIPEYDGYQIDSQEKTKLLQKAYMREFDRFTLIIDNIANTQDINKVPLEYINYLAQLIGYQREDYLLLNDASYRELLKNIIEIYKIKGSTYSFELFFNFLGFNIDINEFWFDKRYGDSGIASNVYTGSVNKDSYLFYLTPTKPTNAIIEDMTNEYSVNSNDITPARNLKMFNQYTGWEALGDSRGYTHEQLLGDTTGYPDDIYTYFKTNIVQYSLKSLGTDQDTELDADELSRIEYYAQFLTPVYIERQVLVSVTPYSDDESSELYFFDRDRADPIYRDQTIYTRAYDIEAIDVNIGEGDTAGDTRYDYRAKVTLGDTDKALYDWIHRRDYIYLDTGDTNEGSYFVSGDSERQVSIVYDSYEVSGWRYGDTGEAGDSYIYVGDSYIVHDDATGYTYVLLKGHLPGVDQTSASGTFKIGGPDPSMHLHIGKGPRRDYWGDTVYGDSWYAGYGAPTAFTNTAGDSKLKFNLTVSDEVAPDHSFVSKMPVSVCYNIAGDTRFLHTYVKERGDTYILLDDALIGDSSGIVLLDTEIQGGYTISGYHNDTYYAVGDTSNSISAYRVLQTSNPTWSDERIIAEINRLEQTGGLFNYTTTTYKIRNRDILVMVDAQRNQQVGDSISSAGDSFTLGDSYWEYEGDSKGRLEIAKNGLIYNSSGDSDLTYEVGDWVSINGASRHLITNIGDTYIQVIPYFDEGINIGFVYKINNWKNFTIGNEGDSIGDSFNLPNTAWINQQEFMSAELAETGNLTLGMNAPMIPYKSGRPIEIQDSIDIERGLVLSTSVLVGTVQVSDIVGDTGDTLFSAYENFTTDDYIRLNNTNNDGVYKVASVARTTPLGDTVIITMGDSLLGSDQTSAAGYITFEEKCALKSIVTQTVTLYDSSRKFEGLLAGDTILIMEGDSNNGAYTITGTVTHTRSGLLDVTGETSFAVTESLDHDITDIGTVRLYSEFWNLGDTAHQSGFDYINIIKTY